MIELVDPRGVDAVPERRLAPRRGIRSLRRIGFLCNETAHLSGPHFAGYAAAIEAELRGRLGIEAFDREVKPVLSLPAEAAQLGRFAGCDGVVNGLAK